MQVGLTVSDGLAQDTARHHFEVHAPEEALGGPGTDDGEPLMEVLPERGPPVSLPPRVHPLGDGAFRFVAEAEAVWMLGGKEIGSGTWDGELPPGTHEVTVRSGDHEEAFLLDVEGDAPAGVGALAVAGWAAVVLLVLGAAGLVLVLRRGR